MNKFEWQPAETAPKDGSWILCYRPRTKEIMVLQWSPFKGWSGPFSYQITISHWAPLPEPPKE